MSGRFTPPNGPVRWLVTNVATGETREVIAQTAFFAVASVGWSLSTATAEQVKS